MPELSFWGWGYREKSPGPEEVDFLADRIENRFDVKGLTRSSPPELDEIELPEPELTSPEDFTSILSTDRYDRAVHTYGKGYADLVRGFRGNFSGAPDMVAWPSTEEHLTRLMDWARADNVALVPVGGSTNVVQCTEPDTDIDHEGLVAVSMRNFDNVLDVDPKSRLARIQAGATGPELENQLGDHDLTLRHYPQSYEFSTLGGWIATRSSGHFATVETRIDDLMMSCRCLTPSGPIDTPKVPSSGAGPDPNGPLLGSEGILGFITEATMRVRPRPTFRSGGTIAFEDFNDGIEACRSIVQSGLNPANARLISRDEVRLYELDENPTNLLFVGYESASVSVETPLDKTLKLVKDHNGTVRSQYIKDEATSETSQTQNKWRQAFFEAPYLYNGMVQLGMIVDTFETCCRWSDFDDLHDDIMEQTQSLLNEICGDGIVTARVTHLYPEGPAPYYTVVAPSGQGKLIQQWSRIKETISDIIRKHDATITHHHAVGRRHQPWYLEETPELFNESLKEIKSTLDPNDLLNPGNLI